MIDQDEARELHAVVEKRRKQLRISKREVALQIDRHESQLQKLRQGKVSAPVAKLLRKWLEKTANGTAPEAPSETQSVLEEPADRPEPATAEETRDCLLLVGDNEIPDIDEIEDWTQEQRDAAAAWACAVHCQASDNDDVEVPPLPEELRERLADLGAWSSVPAPAPTVEPCPSCDCPRGTSSVCEHCGDGGTVPQATEFEIVEPEPGTVPPDEWEGPGEEPSDALERVEYNGAWGRFRVREQDGGGVWSVTLEFCTGDVTDVASVMRQAHRLVFRRSAP